MCVDMCIDMCVDMCIDMCLDMCMDMCIDVCVSMASATIDRRPNLTHACAVACMRTHKARIDASTVPSGVRARGRAGVRACVRAGGQAGVPRFCSG